jgi:hypothetical protein
VSNDRLVTVEQLIKLIGAKNDGNNLTARRIQQLVNLGLIPRAERGKYDWLEAWRGYTRFLQDSVQRRGPQELATRKAELDIEKQEQAVRRAKLQNDREEGLLLPVEHVEQTVGELLQNLRTKALTLPSQGAVRVFGLETQAEVHDELRHMVYDMLDGIASIELTDDDSHTLPDETATDVSQVVETDGPST